MHENFKFHFIKKMSYLILNELFPSLPLHVRFVLVRTQSSENLTKQTTWFLQKIGMIKLDKYGLRGLDFLPKGDQLFGCKDIQKNMIEVRCINA